MDPPFLWLKDPVARPGTIELAWGQPTSLTAQPTQWKYATQHPEGNGSGLAIYNPIITLEDTTDDIIAIIRWQTIGKRNGTARSVKAVCLCDRVR